MISKRLSILITAIILSCSSIYAGSVFDETGKVRKCNQLFASLVGLKTRQILKTETLMESIQFSIKDNPLTIADILDHPVPSRIDEVTGASKVYPNLNLILGDQDTRHVALLFNVCDQTYKRQLPKSVGKIQTVPYNKQIRSRKSHKISVHIRSKLIFPLVYSTSI